jgi:hypothetical protein
MGDYIGESALLAEESPSLLVLLHVASVEIGTETSELAAAAGGRRLRMRLKFRFF